MSVYGIVVLSMALAALGILLETFIEVSYAVVGIMIMLGNTFLLCLIFIPKVRVRIRIVVCMCVYTGM